MLQTPSKAATNKSTSLRRAVLTHDCSIISSDAALAPVLLYTAWKDWREAEQRAAPFSLQSAARLARMLDSRLLPQAIYSQTRNNVAKPVTMPPNTASLALYALEKSGVGGPSQRARVTRA